MSSPSADNAAAKQPPGLNRRQFLRRAGAGAGAMALASAGYAWQFEPHWVEIVRRPLPVAGLPQRLVGKRLVQVSDIHAGHEVDQRWLVGVLEGIAALEPDILVFTGDSMTCIEGEQIPAAVEALGALPRAPLGTFAVMGNHDYGYYFRRQDIANRLTDELERREIRVLSNDVAVVDGLQIGGVDDFWSGRHAPLQMFEKLSADMPAIALCHNPDAMDFPSWQEFQGWVLAGHTHGGQCKAPFFRAPIVPVRNKRYSAGEYALGPGRQMYVNRGLGHLLQVRFNCRPEITVFALTQA